MEEQHYTYTLAYPESMGGRVFYVGKGVGNRINQHEWEARGTTAKKGQNAYKINVIRKIWANGEQVVKTKVASFETHEEACWHEKALIFFMDGLTNITIGGDGVIGFIHTKEWRQKISEAHKKRTITDEHRRKMVEGRQKMLHSPEYHRKLSEAQKGHAVSLEQRRKLSEINKKRYESEEARQVLREANLGKKHTKETRRKMSLAHTGKPKSEEHKRKTGEANRGRKHTEETRRKNSEAQKTSIRAQEALRRMNEAKRGKPSPKKGIPLSEEQRRKMGETRKCNTNLKREQTLLKMRHPIISPTDVEWKQEVVALSLWDETM